MKPCRAIGLSAAFFLLICVSDAVIESVVFHEKSFWNSLIFDVSGHALYLRSVVTLCFLLFGLIVSRAFARQRTAEQALTESEKRYRTVADFTHDWESWTDAEGRVLWVSPSCETVTGYSAEEFLARPSLFREIVHPDDLAPVLSHFRESPARAGNLLHSLDFRIVHRNGEIRWINHVCQPVLGESGELLGRRSSNRDISPRRSAEEALAKSEEMYRRLYEEANEAQELYRSLLSSSPDAIVVYDLNGHPHFVNDSFVRMFGWTMEEVVGKRIPFVPESEQRATGETIQRIMEKGEAFSAAETKRLTKDGSLLDVRLSASRYHDLSGKPAGMLVILRNVTERKRAEDETRRIKLLLTTILQNLPTPVFLKDAEELRYIFWNKASEELYGYSSEHVVGKTAYEVFAPEQAERFELQDRETLETGRLSSVPELIVETTHKGTRVLHSRKLPILDENGKPQYLVGISEDITERREAERVLIEARKAAEDASRAKSEFLANMSHEIRTPMNGIMGMTELALSTELTPEQYEYLDAVRISADSLLKLINDILDFSKIEAGKLELIDVEFSLRDAIADTMTILAVQAHQKKLELLYQIPPEVPDAVVGDPGRLRQILTNLVGNAIKFTEHGEVVLSIEMSSEADTEVNLHVSVADTGIGIPHEKQQTIFSAFEQADGSISRKYGGTGLGLAISSRFCEMMGGKIWLESEVGTGSTFHFTLGFRLQENRAQQEPLEEIDRLKGLRVLLVDDNATNRRILEQALRYAGMEPESVDSGRGALFSMRKAYQDGQPFPVVITDCMMPEMDGFRLVEHIKQDPSLSDSVILMLTSSGERGDAARCVKLGIAAYLLKPVKQAELLFTISRVLHAVPGAQSRPALFTRHSIRESRRRLNVLVVEDNPVNQKLAVRMIERMGHTATVAGNGLEALETLERLTFDLVLMDVQMPRMDGLEATRALRARERATGGHIPVIAMTAYAMKGDKEKCLDAGMDGYVSKPISAHELQRATDQILGLCETGRTPGVTAQTRESLVDKNGLWDRVGGDPDLLREIVDLFADDCPRLLREIKEGFQEGNAVRVEKAAHTIKGSVSNFAADAAVQAALRVENMGRTRDLAGAQEAISQLERAIDWVREELAALGKEAHLENTGGGRRLYH
jgi:two-component system, sensor histidine kinase and response regulator